ncbi:MAG: peptide/nickel transport system substrate-binding protein [Gammaproteobacteria bacterium]|nr:peptide/nickel transport system substrate-binding protein [Gammaproteobacteria bacterium]
MAVAHTLKTLAVCGVLLLGCAIPWARAGEAPRAPLLRARLNSDIVSTNPGTRRDENTDGVLLHIVEGLVASREDGSVGPMLASRWSISADGRVYTFALRPEVMFHNGAPLTSAEVVWSLKRYLKPETRWRCLEVFGPAGIARVESISAPDPHTVVVTLDRAAPMFLTTLARADCGGTGIMHPASVGADGSWIAPIGTGPFQLGEWRHNQFVQLKRFPLYAALPGPRDGNTGGKHALVDELRFLIIPDSSAARAALVRGSLDIIDNLAPSELMGIRGRTDLQFQSVPILDCYTVLIQTQDPALQDVRVRTAIALTIDAVGLTKAITRGTGSANNSPIPVASPFHHSVEAQLRQVNVAKARELLKAGGYDGRAIKLVTSRRDPQMFDAAVVIQAMAAEAGLQLQIDTVDWPAHLSRYIAGTYQLMVQSFSARLDPALSFGVFIGDKREEPRKVWDTPRSRELFNQTLQTADPASRQAVFDTLTRDFLEEVPAVVLYNSSRLSVVRSAVIGHQNWMSAQPRLWGVSLR